MGLSGLLQGDKKLIMVGGKGGVGKTTCAAAIALRMAEEGKRTLIISSDPTPSLSDIFEIEVGDRITGIPGAEGLWALEISSEVILSRWKERFGPEIYEVVSSFADLEYDFVLNYIGRAPGIEEEYMLYYIVELVKRGEYEVVIWDTAPAGHTLKLLHLPELFLRHLEGATKFYLNLYSYVEKAKEAVRLRRGKRSLLEIISGWEELSREIASFIRDRSKVEYIVVTISEALGVRQTERILKDLEDHGLRAGYLIVNHYIKEADCDFHRRRKEMQEGYLSFLKSRYGEKLDLLILPLFPLEIKGLERIREVSVLLFQDSS